MKITRRDMLRRAAGFCAASAIGGFNTGCKKAPAPASRKNRVCPVGTKPFNIILHGLFFVEVWDGNTPNEQRVRVISPKCSNITKFPHVHVAGSWKNQNFTPISNSSSPGWTTDVAAPPDYSGLTTFAGYTGKVRQSRIHHALDLPWPDFFTPLRNVDPSTVITGGVLSNASIFPLTLALTYQCGAPQDFPPIYGTDWSKDHNYHIFSEPSCKICDPNTCGDPCQPLRDHAGDIRKCILDCFDNPPDFQLEPKSWACEKHPIDNQTGRPEISPDEEQALSEIHPCLPFDRKLFSIHLPLCASLILTP